MRLFKDFRRTLEKPEDIWVWSVEARRKFALTKEDLAGLTRITKESPYEADDRPFTQVSLREAVELALKKHGEDVLLHHFWSRYLASQQPGSHEVPSLYGNFDRGPAGGDELRFTQKNYWYNAPSTTTVAGKNSILQGLRTNVGICSIKGCVWVMTGSHVVFADLMHSVADVANYSYRLLELNNSAKHRDMKHPYGYAPLRYITADRSFVFLLLVGGVMPACKGLHELAGGHVLLCDHIVAPLAVFVASAVLEGKAVKTAYREILAQAEKERVHTSSSWRWELDRVAAYLRHGRDVMSTATFTESSTGVIGAGVGLVSLGASWWLQSGVPDVVGSIIMASMVCGVSSFLLRKSGNALLGQTLPSWRVDTLVLILQAHPSVAGVYDVKTEMVGTDTVRFKAEVQFKPQAITARMLQTGLDRNGDSGSDGGSGITSSVADPVADPDRCPLESPHGDAYQLLSGKLQGELQELSAVASAANLPEARERVLQIAPWLYRNNDIFYEALAWELKDVERALRTELLDFGNVHIDLEPW